MNNDIQDRLEEAERTFESSPGTVEEGLDVDDAELVQLRRACRLSFFEERIPPFTAGVNPTTPKRSTDDTMAGYSTLIRTIKSICL